MYLDFFEHWVTSEISEVYSDAEEAESVVVFVSVSIERGFAKKFAGICFTSEDKYPLLPS